MCRRMNWKLRQFLAAIQGPKLRICTLGAERCRMTILRSPCQRVVAGFDQDEHRDPPPTLSSCERPTIDDCADPKIERAAMMAICSDMAILSSG